MTDKLLSFSKMLQQQEEQRQAKPSSAELRSVESVRPTDNVSHMENTSPPILPSQALRNTSLVESVSPAGSTSLAESTMDIWAGFTEWKEGYLQLPNMIALVLYRHLGPAERAIYQELYQLSWGFGNSVCKISLPRLAERAGMKQTAAHEAIKRLVKMGLVVKSAMVFGKGKDQGIEYSLPLPERLVESIRLARSASPAESVNNKIKALKDNTQTQESAAGVRVGSRFSIKDCRKYAEHLRASGQGITNPGGYATTIHRTGEADLMIEAFLNPAPTAHGMDTSNCPDCQGTGFYYPKGREAGVVKCLHNRLT